MQAKQAGEINDNVPKMELKQLEVKRMVYAMANNQKGKEAQVKKSQ